MGCWYATDLVTRVPILPGEDIVAVAARRQFMGVVQECPHVLVGSLQKIRRGTYDEYGWVTEDEHPRVEPEDDPILFYFRGKTWDALILWMTQQIQAGYPGVHEYDRPFSWQDMSDFWEEVTQRWENSEDTETRRLLADFKYIYWFCRYNRIPIIDDLFAGDQRGVTEGSDLVANLILTQAAAFRKNLASKD